MAGSVGNNLVNSSDSPEGFASVGKDSAFEDMPKELLKLFKEVEKVVDRISKNWANTSQDIKKTAGSIGSDQPGSGRLGLGSFSKTEKAVGIGLGLAAVGSTAMSMAPDTMAAVTQRMGADTFAGVSGMSSRQAILQANRQVGGGATSAMGPTMAAMNLYSSGYTANSLSSKNIMSQLGGLSAITGMSNEQAASSMANMNGMSFLRAGIRVRDSNGNLRPPNQLINEVYNFLYRGRPVTKEQAALVMNPGSKGYSTLMQITGGDTALMQTLQSGIMARASNGKGLSASQMSDPNQMLNTLGVDQSSPIRANFRYNSSENSKLASTEPGLVGGYDSSLRTASSLNDAYSKMANLLGPVNQGLMTLKGILQTFPNAGGMGGTVSKVGSTALGIGSNVLQYKMMSKFLSGAKSGGPSLLGRLGSFFKGPTGEELLAMAESVGGPTDHGNLGTGASGGSHPMSFASPVPRGTTITSPFGHRTSPGGKGSTDHKGIDFGTPVGSALTAITNGHISSIGNEAMGYGNWVEVQHADGTKSRYAHMSQINVSRGQKVRPGDIIGRSGGKAGAPGAGNSTGPHLHFELLNDKGVKINPAQYLSGAPASPINGHSSPTIGPKAISGQSMSVVKKSNYPAAAGTADLSSPSLSSTLSTLGPNEDVGGPIEGMNVEHSMGANGSRSAVINVNMKVYIQQGSVAEAERLVKVFGDRLKTSNVLDTLARSL